MGSVELPVDHHAERDQTNDYRCGDEPVAQPDAGQPFRAGVIFRHGLQNNAPPKVPIDLDVPLVPTGVGGLPPAFFVEKIEDRTEQVMAVLSIFAPITSVTQSAGELDARG